MNLEKKSEHGNPLMFGLDDCPNAPVSMLAAVQHLLAVIGGILTAPLIIALGMGLPLAQTNYLLTSALLISGVATCIQISRVGVFGSGLLAIQGTSFTFIGPILFSFYQLPELMDTDDKLAVIFGSCLAASLVMMALSYHLERMKNILTPTVTGSTVVLLGASLVWATLQNIFREYQAQQALNMGWTVLLLSLLVFGLTLTMSLWRNPWVRLSSIMSGLLFGYAIAIAMGLVDFQRLSELDNTALPIPFRFGLGFDWGVFFVLMPIFIVSATESIGDLTATSALSRVSTSGRSYWQRIRGGVLGDSLNSFIAGCFGTFPNTTFSQNNGVIRLTGIASKRIGYIVAGLLIVLGLFPVIGGLFQIIPSSVIYGSTLLMFMLVGLAGVSILQRGDVGRRGMGIAIISIAGGWGVSLLVPAISLLPDQLAMILQFPVSTGAFIAMFLEYTVNKSVFSNPR